MSVYVISDLHLMDRNEPFLFNKGKEVRFCKLCDFIFEAGGQLVLAGDIFDFTGMTPPRQGLAEFFNEVVPKEKQNSEVISEACRMRSTEDLLVSIKKIFPDFFASLKRLAENSMLTYIPGNHDCDFLGESGRIVFAKVLQVKPDKIRWTRQFEHGNSLLVVHGNEYDPQNKTTKSCRNPGFVFTSALYHGVLPALKMLSIQDQIIAAIPAVRPEEQVISGLKHYLDENTLKKILLALTRLLARNGFFHGPGLLPGFLLTHPVPLLSRILEKGITVERVKGVLPKDELLILNARKGSKKLRGKNPEFRNAVIVMGHTHELDIAEKYVNLGTWIDHLPDLNPESLKAPELSLPVLKVDADGNAGLYDLQLEHENIFDPVALVAVL